MNQVADFRHLLSTSLEAFIQASQALGEPMISLAMTVKNAFVMEWDLIQYGLSNPEPPQDSEIMSTFCQSIREIVDSSQGLPPNSPFVNHFATIREAICALGWISVKPAPTQYIRDMRDAGMYYSNRVLQSHKGDNLHIVWVDSWGKLLTDLHDYVKKFFLTGFTYNTHTGGNAGIGGPPPPPPPPPAEYYDAQPSSDNSRQALLNDLNQGAAITRSLKPVSRFTAGVQSSAQKPMPAVTGKIAGASKNLSVKPPKFALEGRKWIVENQMNNQQLTIANDDMAQSMAMFKCENSCLQVKNKMNSVSIDSCKKTNVAVKAIISSVEIIRCERLKIQCDGNIPLINIDSSDSIEIYLSQDARGVEIISSKSNSCNVCLLEADGNYKEISIPEQIKTTVSKCGKKLESSVVEKI